MEQAKIQFFEEHGIDYKDGLGRFMNNAALFEKFLWRFPEDATFGALKNALDADDCAAAFHAAHTLKGVAGNLSLKALVQAVSRQTEILRGGDLAGGKELMGAVTAAYEEAVQAILSVR